MTDMLDTSLVYFVAVAATGSMSAAAKNLHISQPSVSAAVKRLESRLGCQLFHRHARGVSLTRAGELLHERALQASVTLAAARDEIDALETEPRGRYVLGCHPSLAAYFLPGFMRRLLARFPGIRLSLLNAGSRAVEEAVVERRCDLGLVVNARRFPDCVVRPLFRDRVALVAAGSLLRNLKPEEVLRSRPLFVVPSLDQARWLLDALQAEEMRPNHRIECSSLELVKSLVLDGAGAGILPSRVAAHGVARGRVVPLSEDLPSFEDVVSLVWRSDTPMTAGLRALIDTLRERGERLANSDLGSLG